MATETATPPPGSPAPAERPASAMTAASSPGSVASSADVAPVGQESPRSVLEIKASQQPLRLILHNDSTGCTAAAPGRRLERSDLALPRPNTRLEEAVAVVTQCAFFTMAQLLPIIVAWCAFAAVVLRSPTAALLLATVALATALPPGARSQPFLHSRVWDCWRRRFRYSGVVPPVPFCAPGVPHVFAHFPHAVFPMGSFLSFPLCGDPATGVPAPMEGLCATVLLRVPFYKHVFAWLGCHPADKPRMMAHLAAGRSVGVIVEGVAGIFHGATPSAERVYLSNRKGFVKAALQAGAPLVPVYHLGASQLLSFSGVADASRAVRASLGVYWGARGVPLPRRHDIISLVGRPIVVPRVDAPTQEEVDSLHARFCAELVALFDLHKHLLGPEWEAKTLKVV